MTYKKFFFVINHAKNMRDRKNVFFFKAGSGSEIRFKNSDLQDPDPAENGPDPQPWFQTLHTPGSRVRIPIFQQNFEKNLRRLKKLEIQCDYGRYGR